MTKKQLKYYIKGWVRKHNRGFDFERYWNPPRVVFAGFPAIKRVYNQMIGIDLVRVQPMEPPRGILQWAHFVGNEPNPEIAERYSRQVINPNLYGTLNITQTEVEQNNELQREQQRLRRQRIIQLWENQIEFLNR